MLYVVVVFDENEQEKRSELISSISALNLPAYDMSPAYFVSFSGSAKDLAYLLRINLPNGPQGAVISIQGYYLSACQDKEEGLKSWMDKNFPDLIYIPD